MTARLRFLMLSVTVFLFLQPYSLLAAEPDSLLEAIHSRIYPSRAQIVELLKELEKEGYVDSTAWASNHSQKELLMDVWSGMAFRSFDKSLFAQSVERILVAKGYAIEVGNEEAYRECLSLEGVCMARMGRYDDAIRCFNENIEQDEKNEDMSALSSDFNNLAAIYLSAGRIEEAHTFILQAIDYEERVPGSPALPIRYGIASEIDVKLGRLEEALEMIEEACKIDSLNGNALRFGRRLSQKGDVLLASGNEKEAESEYLRAEAILREQNEPNSLSINLKQLGTVYNSQGRKAEALKCWTEGLELAEQTSNKHLQQQFCEKLYLFYKGTDNDKALSWLEQATEFKDSLNSLRNEQMMDENTARFQTLQKEAIIAQQRLKIRHREVWLIVIGIASAVLATFIAFLIRMRRKERELATTREEVRVLQKALQLAPSPFVTRLSDYIGRHISDKTITNQQLCDELGMSPSSLNRHVQSETGFSAQGFIMQLRMEKAKRMLASTEDSINSIANACGFDNFSYFTRVFKQTTGVTPSQYRRQLHNV